MSALLVRYLKVAKRQRHALELGRKLEAIRNLSVAQPEMVGPAVAEFCTAIERAEATAQAQRSFNWTERNPETRAILAELDTVCKKLSALTRDYFWGVQEHMYLYNVNTLLVCPGDFLSSKCAKRD